MDLQNISERAKELWNECEIRVMILLSLSLQILLIISGKQRQCTARKWVGNLIWLAYLSADFVATVSLSIISRSQGDSSNDSSIPNNALLAFWAPFLLLHLGGPDTITAFSLEDNELWKRHLLQLLIQVGVAVYVLFRSWSNNVLNFVAIPVFIGGIIKYLERNWVLRNASAQQLRDSLLFVKPKGMQGGRHEFSPSESGAEIDISSGFVEIIPEARYLNEAYFLLQMFLRLYSGIIVRPRLHMTSYKIMRMKSAQEAFKLIEVELGFMYDVLYTKATIVHSLLGCFFRSISCLSSVSALVFFSIIICKQSYLPVDKNISYTLLIGSVVLEIYAILVILFSDWAMLWVSKQKNSLANFLYQHIYSSFLRSIFDNEKRWTVSMAQFSLLSHCRLTVSTNILKFKVEELFGFHETRKGVDDRVKELIFQQLLEKRERCNVNSNDRLDAIKQVLAYRGGSVLHKRGCHDDIGWSVDELDFHQSLLGWHIATDLCYQDDCRKYKVDVADCISNSKMSKVLSGYMGYLLFRHPFLLPRGICELRCHATREEAIKVMTRFSGRSEGWNIFPRDPVINLSDVYSKFFDFTYLLREENPDTDLSVLVEGCKLAKSLQSLVADGRWTDEEKWEMISEVWMEMLTYAASQCGWKEHAKQLTQGGELLTHVSALMAHLGLNDQCWDEHIAAFPW